MIRSLRFLFERKKAIDHYTVYGGTLLIRNDADGKSYLYDLLDVEKKKVISKTSFSAETHSEVTSPKPSDTSILTDGENVKSQFSLKAYSEAEKKDHVKSAKEFFGKTYSWNETGYITTDGTKLDFFGRHDGAPGGQTGRRGDGSGHLPRQTPTISIHAPREGGTTAADAHSTPWGCDFNPRPPRGGRPPRSSRSFRRADFNPRPPRGGRLRPRRHRP